MEEQYKDLERLIKDAGVDHPSLDFSKKVMTKIERLNTQTELVYTPLISKKMWFGVAVFLCGLIMILLFLPESNSSILDRVDLSFLNFERTSIFKRLTKITFHQTTLYGILFLSFMFLVQIPLLKRRIDRGFSI